MSVSEVQDFIAKSGCRETVLHPPCALKKCYQLIRMIIGRTKNIMPFCSVTPFVCLRKIVALFQVAVSHLTAVLIISRCTVTCVSSHRCMSQRNQTNENSLPHSNFHVRWITAAVVRNKLRCVCLSASLSRAHTDESRHRRTHASARELRAHLASFGHKAGGACAVSLLCSNET
jgi:hypothetical protein